MNTLSSRILASHAVFVLLLISLTVLTTTYNRNLGEIRGLRSNIFQTNSEILTLINNDIVLRTEEVKEAKFYRDLDFHSVVERNEDFDSVRRKIQEILSYDVIRHFEIEDQVTQIQTTLNQYNDLHERFMRLHYKRGFRDYGLEGTMRESAHELENYPEQFPLSQLLSLRRHEKDFFLRSDAMYVSLFNQRAERIQEVLKRSPNELSDFILHQLDKYVRNFNEIVSIEKEMGDHNEGLVFDISVKKSQIIDQFAMLSDSVDAKAEIRVEELVSSYLLLVGIGMILLILLGYASAGFVTRSVKRLAESMKQAIKMKYQTPVWKPNKFSSDETKSLYVSYRNLLSTIRTQLAELERKNKLLSQQNTELNKVNNLLESSQATLEESNAIKDKFFSIVGHDLRGPMANLTMTLHLLSEGIENTSKEEMARFTAKMLDSAGAISMLLDNLLQWSKTQTTSLLPRKEEIRVAAMVENIKKLQSQRVEDKQIIIESELDANMLILGDRNMLDLVIRNLIDNAIKFTRTGGTIRIYSSRSDKFINFHIADSGIGIAKEDQETLFTSIVKKQSVGTRGEKGTGLGLVLAFDFVRKHGGKLSVQSEPNKGSIFTISLPIADLVDSKAMV